MRSDEQLILRMDVLSEFPEGVPKWMEDLPTEELRLAMQLRREGFTSLGFDPTHDELDPASLH